MDVCIFLIRPPFFQKQKSMGITPWGHVGSWLLTGDAWVMGWVWRVSLEDQEWTNLFVFAGIRNSKKSIYKKTPMIHKSQHKNQQKKRQQNIPTGSLCLSMSIRRVGMIQKYEWTPFFERILRVRIRLSAFCLMNKKELENSQIKPYGFSRCWKKGT